MQLKAFVKMAQLGIDQAGKLDATLNPGIGLFIVHWYFPKMLKYGYTHHRRGNGGHICVQVTHGRVILILMKVGILTSTWFQNVPFCSLISEQFLFSSYDHSFRCP